MSVPTTNNDEIYHSAAVPDAHFIGNFHKTLPHNEYGEVIHEAYEKFRQVCLDREAGIATEFEGVPQGINKTGYDPKFDPSADCEAIKSGAGFTNPLAGASDEFHGPHPKAMEMPPAPGILSLSTAAEMVELYWMAKLRDVPLVDFAADTGVKKAITEIESAFNRTLTQDKSAGRLKLVQDLPEQNGALRIDAQTVFRCGLEGEDVGPLVSQFLIRDIPYGVQTISQKQTPYSADLNFLNNYDDWLRAQITGKDKYGRDYGTCNNYKDQLKSGGPTYYAKGKDRYISTMRDLARFVNRDALHQAYFNAALFLDAVGAKRDIGNPYLEHYKRQGGFGTLGGPDLLTLVSEVASRALKVVWRQKWLVHRRARPEVYGGLLHMQRVGMNGKYRNYGLLDLAAKSGATPDNYFLPMAFSAGSPAHPAYGAGHATVAGACVTILKAWFDEGQLMKDLLPSAEVFKEPIKDPSKVFKDPVNGKFLLKPGSRMVGKNATKDDFEEPTEYNLTDSEAEKFTVGGELNKLASNIAMGRSMGGVHWRSDNTRSLRLGEKIAIEILRKRTIEYAEQQVSFTFRSFDRYTIRIENGQVFES